MTFHYIFHVSLIRAKCNFLSAAGRKCDGVIIGNTVIGHPIETNDGIYFVTCRIYICMFDDTTYVTLNLYSDKLIFMQSVILI